MFLSTSKSRPEIEGYLKTYKLKKIIKKKGPSSFKKKNPRKNDHLTDFFLHMSVWTVLKNYSYLSLKVCCISTPLLKSTRDAAIPLSDQVRFFGTRGHLKEKKKKKK